MENFELHIELNRDRFNYTEIEHTITFYTERIINDVELFKQGLQLLFEMDQELKKNGQPIEFDTICRKQR